MNLDKESLTVIIICMVLLILWPIIFPGVVSQKSESTDGKDRQSEYSGNTAASKEPLKQDKVKTPEKKRDQIATEALNDNGAVVKKNVSKDIVVASSGVSSVKSIGNIKKLSPVTLENSLLRVVIDPNNGSLESIELKKKFCDAAKKNTVVLDRNISPGALAVITGNQLILTGIKGISGDDGISFSLTRSFRTEEGVAFELRQRWKLIEHYQLSYNVEIVNSSSRELALNGLRVSVGEIPQMQVLCGDKIRRKVYGLHLYLQNEGKVEYADALKEKNFPYKEIKKLGWISISNKYFCCILFAQPPLAGCLATMETHKYSREKSLPSGKGENEYSALNASGLIGDINLSAGATRKWNYTYFSGPKSITLLKMVDPHASEIMSLAWFSWLEWISQMLLTALIYLNNYVNSWGWSIIILTIIVRGAFWPITQKANASMRKMSKLKPLMEEINQKYKDNPQLKNMKVMELYKEHKVNPLGGCLPILLQIPVFIALYCTLDGTVELRHASFLWANDLSRPDTIAVILGIPINPLVLMWTVLLVIQQLITPTAMDPAQKNMMMAMPVVMLYFLYSLPSGLTLYWTVSQVIAIIQMLINKRFLDNDDPAPKDLKKVRS